MAFVRSIEPEAAAARRSSLTLSLLGEASLLALLAVLVLSVVWSLQAAAWAPGLQLLTSIALAGLVCGYAFARSRGIPRVVLHLMSLLAGAVWVIFQVTALVQPVSLPLLQKVARLYDLYLRWESQLQRTGYATDATLFVLAVGIMVWLLSYWSVWFVFRAGWAWWAVICCGIALLINLAYIPSGNQTYFILYVCASLLLIVLQHAARQQANWRRLRIPVGRWVTFRLTLAGLALGSVALAAAYALPAGALAVPGLGVWDSLSQPWQDVLAQWNRLFPLANPRADSNWSSFADDFSLGGPVRLGKGPVLRIQTSQPGRYWRALVYQTYDGRGWHVDRGEAPEAAAGASAGTVLAPLPADASWAENTDLQARETVTQTITLLAPKETRLFGSPQPVQFNRGAVVASPTESVSTTVEIGQTSVEAVPLALQQLVSLLGETQSPQSRPQLFGRPGSSFGYTQVITSSAQLQTRRSPLLAEIAAELDRVNGYGAQVQAVFQGGRARSLVVNGRVPTYDDVGATYAETPLEPGATYTVTSSVSSATVEQLREAAGEDPAWVTSIYTQLPASLPERVRNLAGTLTADATTRFDKAKAIERYLRTLEYDENVVAPPAGRDSVDYFLFASRKGYCEYFASAMVVLLRSLDIPARVATGYTGAQFEPSSDSFVVLEDGAHAWVEAYFPGFGWQEFEPTPARSPVDRPLGDTTPDQAVGSDGEYAGSTLPTSDPLSDLGLALPTVVESPLGLPVFINLEPVLIAATRAAPFALAGLMIAMAGLAVWWWGLLGLPAEALAYARVQKLARWCGFGAGPAATPLEYVALLAEHAPETRGDLQYIAGAYVRYRYASAAGEAPRASLARRWKRLRRPLALALLRSRLAHR